MMENATEAQIDHALAAEDRRLDLAERELDARIAESKAKAEASRSRQRHDDLWEQHVRTIEAHNHITHVLLGRIAEALEQKGAV